MKLTHLIVVALLIALVGCDQQTNQQAGNLLLVFGDEESGVDPYQTRVLVTPEFMRFDDGEGSVDFLVFDRKQKTIYNVIKANQSVTVMSAKPVEVTSPIELKLAHKQMDDMQNAPSMQGIKPQHHAYMSGEKVCFEVVSVPGFLPEFVAVMKEFNTVLANNSAATLTTIPADMHEGCDLAESIFAPNRHFEAGFPLQKWDSTGKRQVLLDFKTDYQVDQSLFAIPSGYKRMNMEEIRASLSGT